MRQASLASTILDSMMDGVITLDPKGVITEINPAALEILGLDPSGTEGQSYAQIFFSLPENDDFNQLLLDLVGSQEEKAYAEVPFTRSDGENRYLALTATLLREGSEAGGRQGAILVFKDITSINSLRKQRDQLTQELAEKHEELKKAYVDLEDQNQNLKETQRRFFWIKLVAGVLGLVFFASLVGWQEWGRLNELFKSRERSPSALEQDLRQVKARRGGILVSVPCRGFIEPLKLVTVSAEAAGRVRARLVELGQTAQKGQVLYRLDPSEVLPKVRQAEAALLKARQGLRELQTWRSRPEFLQAKRALELAKLDMARKKTQYDESQQLYKAGIIPRDDLVSARNDFRRAQADTANAEERLDLAREKGSKEKLQVARLELQNAEAAYREIKNKLVATVVRAPVSGVIMPPVGNKTGKQGRFPEVGDKVDEGQAFLVIGSERPLGVRAKVDEGDIRRVKVGQKTLVGCQAVSGEMPGVVRSVAPQALKSGQQTPTFPVIIELGKLAPEKASALRLGMSATVRIVVQEAKNAVLLPILTVGRHGGGPAVRVSQGGKIVWRRVETGLSDRDSVQITRGVKAGETVYY